MNNPVKNFVCIDLLRFVAAFSVYWYHNHIGNWLFKKTSLFFFNFTDYFGSTYAVPLFFFISGFCIHLSHVKSLNRGESLNLKVYFSRRFWRIVPPYLVALLISVATNKLINPSFETQGTDILLHIFCLQGFSETYFNSINVVFWTITVELCFYLLYPIFYIYAKKYRIENALLFSFLVSISSVALTLLTKEEISAPYRFNALNLWGAWSFGAYLSNEAVLDSRFYKNNFWRFALWLSATLFILTFFLSFKNDFLIKDNINIVIWSPVLIVILRFENIFQRHKEKLSILIKMGLSSYSLYLIHEPLMNIKNYLLDEIASGQTRTVGLVIGIFIIPSIAYIYYLMFEKPFIRYSKRTQV